MMFVGLDDSTWRRVPGGGAASTDDLARSPAVSREAVVAFDGDGRVRMANDAARALLDIDAGSQFRALFGPAMDEATVSGGAADVESTELQLRSSPDRWLELTTIRGNDPARTRIAIIRDVTMARRDEAIGEIIPTLLSHELRTPMTSIYAAAQILHTGAAEPLDERRLELVQDLSAEMRRLQLLIDDLTVLCRDDAALGIDPQPELVHRILPEVVASERNRWIGHDIELDIRSEPGVTLVDRGALEHLMRDLISHAAQHGADAPISVMLRAHPRGGAVVLVADGGPGYRARDRRLLRPIGFAYLSSARDGSAISLHVAYRLVAAMGGRIWARSRAPGGEVGFWLRPLDQAIPQDEVRRVQ